MTTARDDLTKAQTLTVAAIEVAVPPLLEAREIVDAFHSLIRKWRSPTLEDRRTTSRHR